MTMTYQEIHTILKNKISPKRFKHIEGVVAAAIKLADYYGANIEDARMAALLHDCCKEYPIREMQDLLARSDSFYKDPHFLSYIPLLHGPVGAIISKEEFGIENEAILEAVRVHTTGKVDMSLLDKIIFLADYIEENRKFPGVDKLREKAYKNLDKAVLLGYDTTISYLIAEKQPIYEGTITARNDLLMKIKEKSKNSKGKNNE